MNYLTSTARLKANIFDIKKKLNDPFQEVEKIKVAEMVENIEVLLDNLIDVESEINSISIKMDNLVNDFNTKI